MKFSFRTICVVMPRDAQRYANAIWPACHARREVPQGGTPWPAAVRTSPRRGSRSHLAGQLLVLIALTGLLTGTLAQESTGRKSTEESRKVALQVSQELTTQLLREMQLSGPVRSLLVCKYVCQEILSSQSRKTGWRVAAVSLKPRNSAVGMPDPWEQKVLADFSRRAANGEKAEALEFAETVTEPQGGYFRYARAMVVEPLCMACHGPREKLSDAVKAALAAHYPFDRATGFSVGQVYGIVSIKRDL